MSQERTKKPATKHLRCVVCGKSFSSVFDEDIRAYKVFHVEPVGDSKTACEDKFFHELLRIYVYIHKLNNSITMNHLVNEYKWLDFVMMKKELLLWCMERGFLRVDNLHRVEVPPKVIDDCSSLFETISLLDDEKVKIAIEVIKEALAEMLRLGELEAVEGDDIPVQQNQIDFGTSKLYKNIDTSDVKLKREKKGMVTASRTGAQDIERRMSSASNSMERRRMERRS